MKRISRLFSRFTLLNICSMICFLNLDVPSFAQEGSYSDMAQNILDQKSTSSAEGEIGIDIFKFSVNEILETAGTPTENSYGNAEIFGRTDYGSEFVLANDLSTTSEIQIPAFVIDILAEDEDGEYLPVIVNGFSDEEDGNYIRSYTNDALNADVEETFNSNGPNIYSFQYDDRQEIQYVPDDGVTVYHNLYSDGGRSKNYFEDNFRVYTETNSNGYSFTNYYNDDEDNPSFAIEYRYEDGSTAFEINENGERYFQKTNSDNSTEFRYTEDLLEIGQNTQPGGSSTNFITKTDEIGNTETIRKIVVPDGVITLEYEKNEAAISVSETYIRNTPIANQDGTQSISYSGSAGNETHIIEEIITENGDSSFYIDGTPFFENVGEIVSVAGRVASKNALTDQLKNLVIDGEEVITASENFNNTNLRAIDFKGFYDEVNGQAITPEMGYVRLKGSENQYINLSNGDLVEFFVNPNDQYYENHSNSAELFFIDRPIAENPVIAETARDGTGYNTNDSPPSEEDPAIYVGPGEEAIRLPSGEIKVYVTTVYVPAPASRFEPTQIVMPVLADGDYNYEIEPAAAETFSDDVQVVAIPEEEAEVLSEKVKEIKRKKEEPTNPKHDEDTPPVLDPGLEAMIKLNIIINDVQKGPSKLLSETKKKIQKEFPNISEQFIDLFINTANSNEKFDLIRDPKEFLDNEFAKITDPIELNLLLSSNLPQEDLIKVYNLILYRFSQELTEVGFETLENQEIDFNTNVKDADQIMERVQLQEDIMAIVSILGPNAGNQSLSNLLIEPEEVDPNSSNALFESSESQKVLDRIKRFSEAITFINSPSTISTNSDQVLDNTLPLIEVNVGVGESIAKALEEKLLEEKRLNRSFQPRSLSSQLEKFNFELPPQNSSSEPPASTSVLANVRNISKEELQVVAETTEATNNILDEIIEKMLDELGDDTIENSTIKMASVSNNVDASNEEPIGTTESFVINGALSSVERLRAIEDIRAIFQTLGIGS